MLRHVPHLLTPGDQPHLHSAQATIDWATSLEWIVQTPRTIALHLDAEARLTCIAPCTEKLSYLGPLSRDVLAGQALDCQAAAVILVDVRRRITPAAPTAADRAAHRSCQAQLAVHGVALLDTIIVAPGNGVSVPGADAYTVDGRPSWLQVHVEDRPTIPEPDPRWLEEEWRGTSLDRERWDDPGWADDEWANDHWQAHGPTVVR
jgi:hypothetical protein